MTSRMAARERSSVERFFDRLHVKARRVSALHRLAVVSRILLALAFIPTGMVKLLGQRFTLMGPDTPVGYFFEAMYQTGFYWNFLGLSQVLAGVLLLIPWTATLGAVVLPLLVGGGIAASMVIVSWVRGVMGVGAEEA